MELTREQNYLCLKMHGFTERNKITCVKMHRVTARNTHTHKKKKKKKKKRGKMHGVTARIKLLVCEKKWIYREEQNYLCVKMYWSYPENKTTCVCKCMELPRGTELPVCENAGSYREEQNYLCVKMHGVTARNQKKKKKKKKKGKMHGVTARNKTTCV